MKLEKTVIKKTIIITKRIFLGVRVEETLGLSHPQSPRL